MQAISFWWQVWQAWQQVRLCAQLTRAQQSTSQRFWQWIRWLCVWGLSPVMALWPYGDKEGWASGMFLLSLVVIWRAFSPPRSPWALSPFEALYTPSRPALYVAKLLRVLPWFLWHVVWMHICDDLYQAAMPDNFLTRILLLTDFAVVVGASRAPRYAGKTIAVSLLLLLICFTFVFVAITLRALSISVNFFMVNVMLIGAEGLILYVWSVARIEPQRQIAVMYGEPWSSALIAPSARENPRRIEPASLRQGRHGLVRAEFYSLNAFMEVYMRSLMIVGVLSIVLTTDGAGSTEDVVKLLSWFGVAIDRNLVGSSKRALIIIVAFLNDFRKEHPSLQRQGAERLYLLGVNYRSQLISMWTAKLIALLLPLCMVIIFNWLEWIPGLDRLGEVTALACGVALFNIGWCPWPRTASLKERWRWGLLLPGFAGLIFLNVLEYFLWAAAFTALLGLAGIGYKLLAWDEVSLRRRLHR